jgi:phosphate:Na+ symporter
MRPLCAVAVLAGLATGLGAQGPEVDAATSEIALFPLEHIDANGHHVDDSGDQTIWTTSPPQHATLRLQVSPAGTKLPSAQPGKIIRRPGAPGRHRIHVESDPPGLDFEPLGENQDWHTAENGVFGISVPVPDSVGEYRFIFKAEDPRVATLSMGITVESPNWLLWLALGMLGGLALFLYGMSVGSEGLQESAGSRFREMLESLTGNPVRGVLTGVVVTIFTQSSSATTVMLVGFVRAGLMTLRQSFGPIFGAAVGTTLTVQLLAFKIQAYSLPLMAVGFLMMFFLARSPRGAAIGKAIFGFGMIFFGMLVMGEVIEPMKSNPGFHDLITRLTSRPLWCLIFVTLFTAVVQSSAATIGIALTLANQGLLGLDEALPIIFGANIGTCITALLASLGGSVDGKRVAWAHLLFKAFGVALFLFWPMYPLLAWMAEGVSSAMHSWLPDVGFLEDTVARQMANADTILNVVATAVAILVLRGPLERSVCVIVPAKDEDKGVGRAKYLDLALLESPQLALGSATREISRMGRFVEEMVRGSQRALESRDSAELEWLRRRDDKVDRAFDRLNTFLTQLTGKNPGQEITNRAIGLLYVINDLESIGDLVVKIEVPIINKMIDQDLKFSGDGLKELVDLHERVNDSLSKTMLALTTPTEGELFDEG